jgi:hypothetical protein
VQREQQPGEIVSLLVSLIDKWSTKAKFISNQVGEPDLARIVSRGKCLNKDIVALPQQAFLAVKPCDQDWHLFHHIF